MKRQVSVIVKQLDCHVRLSVPRHAAKLLQLCLTLCDPKDGSPPGSSVHRIFQARVLELGAIAFTPRESGLMSKGSKGLRSPFESRRAPLGAHFVA